MRYEYDWDGGVETLHGSFYNPSMKNRHYVVTAEEMRAIEARTVEQGVTWQQLMERAGEQVARHAINRLGPDSAQNVLVLAGPGNNGGDALVAARHLFDHGWPVHCLTWSRAPDRDNRLLAPLGARSIEVGPLTPTSLPAALERCSVVIDGILGTGLKRDIEGELADVIRQVANSGRVVVAIDIPTGIDSDTGAVRGAALPAALTVALGHLKYGHVLPPGKMLCGNIVVGDIGLDERASDELASGELLTAERVRDMLPARPEDANKGTFGRVMIVAGSVNYVGAAALATQGAMRSGVGLATLACAGDLMPILASKLTECTFLPLASDLGAIAGWAVDKLRSLLDGYDAVLVGCGLGRAAETVNFVRALLSRPEVGRRTGQAIGFAARVAAGEQDREEQPGHLPPLVLDGDALNILADWEGWHEQVPHRSVLTPHPGEMARLLGTTVEQVQANRAKVAREAAGAWDQIVVLKGAATVIAEPTGKVYISPFANPALATAGTGDVLAGVIAGLIAQGVALVDAACAGVYLHGMAGEMLREQYGPAGGLAGELPVLVAQAQRKLRALS
jgi:NAD(P)H-hydrate epimerase